MKQENIFQKAFKEYATDYINCVPISEELDNKPELISKVSEIIANALMNDEYLWGEIDNSIIEIIKHSPDIITMLKDKK